MEYISEQLKKRICYYVEKYVLPLIGYTIDECKSLDCIFDDIDDFDEKTSYKFKNDKIEFVCKLSNINDASKPANKKIFKDFMIDYIEFEMLGRKLFSSDNYFGYETGDKPFNELMYNNYIERGICRWINSESNSADNLEKLFKTLERWAVKTYEGHHVCYGFLIDLNEKKELDNTMFHQDFMHFLDDEYSAILSDGFSSLIKLDQNCNFIDYLSLTDGGVIKECNLGDLCLPYRFSQLIDTFINNDDNKNVVGIFLLQNGDIIVSKEREIKFIKRNNRWLNFSVTSFEKSIQRNIKNMENKYLNQIYVTALDVSLAHSGGIISVVDYDKLLDKKILNRIDDLSNKIDENELYFNEFEEKYCDLITMYDDNKKNELKKFINLRDKAGLNNIITSNRISELEVLNYEIIKRLTKRNVLLKLLKKENNFLKIDRKLRAELIGMDGACIVDRNFNIISFGAIIRNEAGSSGGGRGAATKTLSCFDGFSIKISTDGYIEVYVNGKKVYSIK